MKNLAILFTLLLLGGCAMGRTTSYQGHSGFKPEYKMPLITLGVIDKRPYVLNGNKSPTYCGTLRSIGGIPYDVNTASGKPLAEMLQAFIGTTLMKHGVNVDSMTSLPMDTTETEAAKILTAEDRKAVLLLLNEWRTHIYFNPIFEYDLKMSAIDIEGNIISSSFNKGTMEFGNDKKVKKFSDVVTIVFDKLFNDQKIKSALLTDQEHQSPELDKTEIQEETKEKVAIPKKSTKEKPKCTTDQILKMKEMGMTNSQIKAACQ